MTMSTDTGVYYDPYDVDIYTDPYPVFKRLREEAPLYFNEQYGFYALSRFEDVEKGLVDHVNFSSKRGGILEMIRADVDFPQGVFICEDPPVHSAHRGVVSRVFTPKKMNALEPQIREFCGRILDPLVGGEGFDFVADLGARDADAGDRNAPWHSRSGSARGAAAYWAKDPSPARATGGLSPQQPGR